MIEGLNIYKKDEYIDNFVQDAAELRLLGKGDGTEIMLQKIKKNETFFINPCDSSDTMEFFYILNGEIDSFDNKYTKLVNGDYFFTHDLKSIVQFKTLTEVTLLYISTKPLFHFLSTIIKELTKLAREVEKKDMYTHSHIKRVEEYAIKIANKLNLPEESIENIAFASLFHDIGKIDTPDEILKKPSALTKEEYDIIKKHPIRGAEIVEKTYYKKVCKIISQHHEKLDGSGYPFALKGEEIMIEARIIAVADAFDAMITDRPYRKGLSYKEAISELKKYSGIHFDANIVIVFINILLNEKIITESDTM
ncbi:HD-GYP domain-containing protein [Helicovermis profundi]|uniref:HD-GYP domain-containing protein n=1 Tax=Helicovermis profundi TaxID=3065157 RepID=A0AAU9E1I8_9FIRM|nr:hypothetical protein HLPR_07420 [Clostridia bacterium S502]